MNRLFIATEITVQLFQCHYIHIEMMGYEVCTLNATETAHNVRGSLLLAVGIHYKLADKELQAQFANRIETLHIKVRLSLGQILLMAKVKHGCWYSYTAIKSNGFLLLLPWYIVVLNIHRIHMLLS